MDTQAVRAERFKTLHERDGAFLIPNPWDAGSARILAGLGFEALATTSVGFANALGRRDGEVTLEEKVRHCRELSAATNLPVSADLENCFADDPEKAAETIVRVAEAVDKPINVLAAFVQDASVAELADAGAKRISIGGALARAAYTALLRAGMQMRDEGSFRWMDGLASVSEINELLGSEGRREQ